MSKKNIALMLVLIGASAVVYHTMTNVHQGDVAAYNNVPQQLHGLLVKAGDIVALTQDGRDPELICRFNFKDGTGQFEVQKTNAVYVNELGKHLPTFSSLFSTIATGLSFSIKPTESDRVEFSGDLSIMKNRMSPTVSTTAISNKCECDMAKSLARKERVCTTLAALTKTGDEFARAVRFARYSNYVNKERFETCKVPYTTEIEKAMTQSCDQFGSLPWDTSFRHFLHLIERKESLVMRASTLATN